MAAAGIRPAHRLHRDAQAGITLVEMLVVLSVIAVAAGVVMLRFPGGSGNTPSAEAAALALVLTAASDQALTSGRARALDWSATGYRLLEWLPGSGWIESAGSQRTLAASSALASDTGAAPMVIGSDALTAPASFTLGSGAAAWVVAFDGLAAQPIPPDFAQAAP